MAISKNKRLLSSYFSVVLSISIVLFMMGAFFLIAFNASKISDDFKEKIPITIYLKNDAKKIEIEQLIKKLNLKDYTNSINYISKEKGAEILINEIGEDFIEFYGTNPLLNSIDVFLKSEFVTTLVFDEISNELNNTDFIDEIIYDAPLISLINDNINKIKYWILGIAMFFLIISILVINSSIRLSIYSNRINIKTMQMVGATRRFIRKPFISTHVKLGLIGSLIAITLLSSSLYYIQNNFEYFNFESEIPLIILMFAAISVFSIIITYLCTFFATQRFLKIKIEQLY
ncbi:permease-like cell division protein FtsX [Flavobacteriaceae bacterium]|nr:permease-like cell division protein FtsX [Flavobacteriaceae bacterium]MDB4087311.1 permease-like cell division protein FtsX [Flavobacteriaceae bacterium]MDB4240331.1 permease-like cell division protein FtsX [Flavobacteriaceae bacterium]MDB9787414.1 permease-like cell division protein FtsX [Flavobacteriaceae bacterium]MDB9901679.1 permease-like cell division protein FtsX [Flavobacteriaceae bacterium]